VTSTTAAPARTRTRASTISVHGVGRVFGGDRPVLSDIDLTIDSGEIVALLGASGCGKSTLLRLISGLDTPTFGSIEIDGTQVTGIDLRCAVGFQEPRLLPWRTIAHNVALGLPSGTRGTEGGRRVSGLLELVGLGTSSTLRPRQISGGMAQRVSLARALAREPGVLVLDEPFGALDALTRLQMQDLLLDVQAAEPTTIVLVTHDVEEALYLADRVVLIGADPGAPEAGSAIRSIIDVPGARPRDRGDAHLAHLRAELLGGLGVPTHHSTTSTKGNAA
jgi:sulfonate transport system ATP-binding protein